MSGAGVGKGLLVRAMFQIAFGRQPHAVARAATAEEQEKRIATELIEAPMHPVSTETLDGIERAVLAALEWREALTALDPNYRFLTLTTVTDELAEVYAMTYQAEQEFRAEAFAICRR
jgi:hypothetical protein